MTRKLSKTSVLASKVNFTLSDTLILVLCILFAEVLCIFLKSFR